MKRHTVNGVTYSDEEWRLNQLGIFFASIFFVVCFFLMIIVIR